MSAQNDGGPAFPLGEYVVINGVPATQPTNGLSLRDYFAAAAMPGLLSYWQQTQKTEHDFAKDAYLIADAMLAQRAKSSSDQALKTASLIKAMKQDVHQAFTFGKEAQP